MDGVTVGCDQTLAARFEPTPEYPTKAQIVAYGEFAFLYLRADSHRNVPLQQARLAIQPPIDLGFFKVFYVDGVPRSITTWAFLGEAAEEKMRRGQRLDPADWVSGNQMWIMSILAPYGKGTGTKTANWLRRVMPRHVPSVRYMRSGPDFAPRRFVQVTRSSPNGLKIRLLKWPARQGPIPSQRGGMNDH